MAPTIRTVATYDTHREHSIDFFVNGLTVTVTRTASAIRRWINDVQYYNYRVRGPYYSHPLVVGVGVQWTPAGYHYRDDSSGGSYNGNVSWNGYYYSHPPVNNNADPPPDTLQLCVGKECLIIQLAHCNRIPDELRRFLVDPQTIFVGIWNHQDAGKLARSRHQLEIRELLDIRNYVQDSRGRSMSHCSSEEIVEVCLGYEGVRLERGISMSDWSVYDLQREQILQAALDVYVCSELGVWVRLWEF